MPHLDRCPPMLASLSEVHITSSAVTTVSVLPRLTHGLVIYQYCLREFQRPRQNQSHHAKAVSTIRPMPTVIVGCARINHGTRIARPCMHQDCHPGPLTQIVAEASNGSSNATTPLLSTPWTKIMSSAKWHVNAILHNSSSCEHHCVVGLLPCSVKSSSLWFQTSCRASPLASLSLPSSQGGGPSLMLLFDIQTPLTVGAVRSQSHRHHLWPFVIGPHGVFVNSFRPAPNLERSFARVSHSRPLLVPLPSKRRSQRRWIPGRR